MRHRPATFRPARFRPDGFRPDDARGYKVFSRPTPSGPDTLLAFIRHDEPLQHLVTGTPGSQVFIHIKPVSRLGVTPKRQVRGRLRRLAFDDAGNLILPAPNAVRGLALENAGGGEVFASWQYIAAEQEAAPSLFNIYTATGAGAMDFTTAAATATGGRRTSKVSLGVFAHGTTVRATVRAETASGAEEKNTVEASIVVDAQAPAGVTSMSVEVSR